MNPECRIQSSVNFTGECNLVRIECSATSIGQILRPDTDPVVVHPFETPTFTVIVHGPPSLRYLCGIHGSALWTQAPVMLSTDHGSSLS